MIGTEAFHVLERVRGADICGPEFNKYMRQCVKPEAMPFTNAVQRSRLLEMPDTNNTAPDELFIKRPFTSARRRWMALGVVIIIAALIYSGWWFWLAGTVREQINVWIDNNRADGRDIEMVHLDVSGFPGVLKINVEKLQIVDVGAGWGLRVPEITATMTPWKINQVDGKFSGPIHYSISKGSASKAYELEATSNDWTVEQDQGGRVRLGLQGVTLKSDDDTDTLEIASLKAVLIRGSVPVYGTLKLTASGITLPARAQSPFGSDVKVVDARLELVGAVSPDNLTAPKLSQWAKDGGAIEVRSLRIVHGILGLNGDGTMALDGRLQPIGAFSARVTGYDAALDQLIQVGLVKPSDGNIAKMILGAMGKVPAGGGPKQIKVPISVQDQRLSVGPIPLMRMPAILW